MSLRARTSNRHGRDVGRSIRSDGGALPQLRPARPRASAFTFVQALSTAPGANGSALMAIRGDRREGEGGRSGGVEGRRTVDGGRPAQAKPEVSPLPRGKDDCGHNSNNSNSSIGKVRQSSFPLGNAVT